MSDPDKSFGEHMHKKHSKKLCPLDGMLDIFTTILVIFDKIGDCLICHAYDSSIAYSNTVRIPAKVFNYRIRSIESFFRVNNPGLFVQNIEKRFKFIMIMQVLGCAVILQFVIFPKLFQLLKILIQTNAIL